MEWLPEIIRPVFTRYLTFTTYVAFAVAYIISGGAFRAVDFTLLVVALTLIIAWIARAIAYIRLRRTRQS